MTTTMLSPTDAGREQVTPLVIRSSGLFTTAGHGVPAFADLFAGRVQPHTVPAEPDRYPEGRLVRPVPPYDRAELLGRRGTRNLDRLTQLGLIAADQAIAGLDQPDEVPGTRVGVAIGTSTGSIETAVDVGLDTLIHDKPYMVNPATFPNTVMNACTGQVAIRHGLRGVNAAVAGGHLSAMLAIRYARTALGCGRAHRMLVGAVEELSARTAWAWHLSGVLEEDTPLGEGAAVFVMESAGGRDVDAPQVLGCEIGYYGGVSPGLCSGLAACIDRALHRSGVTPGDVDLIVPGARGHPRLERLETRALENTTSPRSTVVDIAPIVGETYSLSGALQLAYVVATRAAAAPRVALITSVGEDGNAGAVVVRC